MAWTHSATRWFDASLIALEKVPPQLSARQAVFKLVYNLADGWISVNP